jgi:prepilin-type N-terminal cleavage/methylation domain-containing protein
MNTVKQRRTVTPHSALRTPHSAFTLMELLIVMTILSILAAMTVVGLAAAVNDARITRTRAIVGKIDILLDERWEDYRTKSVAIRIPPRLGPPVGGPTTAVTAATMRLFALRELMRLEMPDQISDLCTAAEFTDLNADGNLNAIVNLNDARRFTPITMPALARSYKRLAIRNMATSGQPWTNEFQSAECLYLILSTMKDHDKSALDYFSTDEVGDVDGDGFKEILDAWGRPIVFVRWPAGYVREQQGPDLGWGDISTDDDSDSTTDEFDGEFYFAGTDDFVWTSTSQTRDSRVAPDPFDPLKVDPRWANTDPTNRPFALRPLIYSAGPDQAYDVNSPAIDQVTLTSPNVPNDPYYALGSTTTPLVGTPADTTADDDTLLSNDNITNHAPETAPQ